MKTRRFVLFRILILVAFAVLGAQLWRFQIAEGQLYKGMAEQNTVRVIPVKAPRGVVYDRNMQLVASNTPSWTVSVVSSDLPEDEAQADAIYDTLASYLQATDVAVVEPSKLPSNGRTAVFQKLAPLIGMTEQQVADLVSGASTSDEFVLIKKDLDKATSDTLKTQLKDLPGVAVMNEIKYTVKTDGADDPFTPLVVKTGVERDVALTIEADHLKLPGVMVGQEAVREYKEGSLLSHILGYVGTISQEEYQAALPPLDSDQAKIYAPDDKVGKTGIEATMEPYLRGSKGGRTVRVDSSGRIVGTLATVDPTPGDNVILTLDLDFQKEVAADLQEGLDKAGVKKGVAIALNPKTGQILSMVSLPSYDDNLFANGISTKDWDQLNNDPDLPMLDRAIAGTYPPGSTFKTITAAAALQEGAINRDTTFNCQGEIGLVNPWNDAQRTYFYCWLRSGHGNQNVVQALANSCDVFFYNAGGGSGKDQNGNPLAYYQPSGSKQTFAGVGIDKINQYAKDFGFGQKTGIELPGEQIGVIPAPDWKQQQWPDEPWSIGDTLNTSIGQGYDLVTPLQLVNATAAIANGGTLYEPQLVDQVVDAQGNVVEQFDPKVLATVPVSAENLAMIREGMRLAVTNGTSTKINLPNVEVAGKTGTAEFGKKDPVTGTYESSHAWFISFAPYNDPEIALVVLVEGGANQLEGSSTAVPIAAKIMQYYFSQVK
jgi:penicillin-binding protein 2